MYRARVVYTPKSTGHLYLLPTPSRAAIALHDGGAKTVSASRSIAPLLKRLKKVKEARHSIIIFCDTRTECSGVREEKQWSFDECFYSIPHYHSRQSSHDYVNAWGNAKTSFWLFLQEDVQEALVSLIVSSKEN
jgi:hypothetical protein